MSVVDFIREGLRDEPNVEVFVEKYELWEALVLNLRFQIDQMKSFLSEHEAPESPELRATLAKDERIYDDEARELQNLALTAILHPLRREAPALATTLAEAMQAVGVDQDRRPAHATGTSYADLERLSAAVTLWRASRN